MIDENTTKPYNERLFKELIFRKIRLDANLREVMEYMESQKVKICKALTRYAMHTTTPHDEATRR